MKKDITYPSEITIKSVFYNHSAIGDVLVSALRQNGLEVQISRRNSKNSKFISFTITAEFESETHLEELCARITSLEGFIMMF